MIIKGWASVFGESDSHSDVTVKGCFVTDLKQFTYTRPMLLSHDSSKIIGRWDLIREKDYGLWCEGTVLDEDAQFWIKERGLSGLSIGYAGRQHKQEAGLRKLQVVELEEISVTAVPMNRAARIVEILDGEAD
jgi:HK97 family phage prohead protease